MDFANKVIWITGASSRIGEALSCEFSRRGAKLILSSRNETELERVKNSCSGNRSDIAILPLDLSDLENAVKKSIRAVSCFGHIDILVNNGGISQRSLAQDTTLAVDREIMTINYFGQIELTKAVLPHMLERGSGHIVVVSSIMGRMATPLRSAYCASKHALHGFFDALRAEVWRKNIKVTLALPASIRTSISQNALTGNGSRHEKLDAQQAGGLGADDCAAQIVKAVEKAKEEVLIGPPVKYVLFARTLLPRLYSWGIRRARVT